MGDRGRLTAEQFGWTMPADAPLYAPLPHYLPDADVLQITYECSAEGALALLPSDLELSDPPTAVLTIFRFPFGTLGAYNEAALDIGCLWQGEPKHYTAYNLVDNDAGLAAGREIWGVPKKQAVISLRQEHDLVMGAVERPSGNRLLTALVRPERPADRSGFDGRSRLCLRLIPNVEEGGRPAVAQLVDRSGHRVTAKRVWEGPGSLAFDSPSAIDPWHRVAVTRILRATYGRYDFTLGYGKIVKDYGAETGGAASGSSLPPR